MSQHVRYNALFHLDLKRIVKPIEEAAKRDAQGQLHDLLFGEVFL